MRDPAKVNSLLHEYWRARDAYDLFADIASKISPSNATKLESITFYNSYIDFVSHLYEFWAGCIRSDGKYSATIKGERIDKAFNVELEKLLSIRRERAASEREKHAPHLSSLYNSPVPERFGLEFRRVRNLRNHPDAERSTYSLSDFFHKYNDHLEELLVYPEFAWGRHLDDRHDWKQIELFAREVFRSRT